MILISSPNGLYCPRGDFYVDPLRPVKRAVITHAHSDHAREGSQHFLAATASEQLLRMRLGHGDMQFLDYGQLISINGVQLSFHPAGHILGSSQVRLEYGGRVEVVTGDFKLGHDPTCANWEPIQCHLLVTESTFGLPVYRWRPVSETIAAVNQWWRESRDKGKCCILYGYAVGKSQRLLAGLDASIGTIYTHGAVEKATQAYRRSGVVLPKTTYVGSIAGRHDWKGSMVVAVPSAHATPWMRRFGDVSTAMASGWMAVRGSRRRRNVDRGFVLSDHVDWPSLLDAVEACDPETVWVTHGYSAAVARYLTERGRHAEILQSAVRGEIEEDAAGELTDVEGEIEAWEGE